MWILSKINNQFHHLVPPSKKSGADDYVEELKLLQVYSPNTGIFELMAWHLERRKSFFLIDSFWKILRRMYIRPDFVKRIVQLTGLSLDETIDESKGIEWCDCTPTKKRHNIVWMSSAAAAAAKLLRCVRLFMTPWTAAYQAPPPMGFSRQEYWSGLPLSSWMSSTKSKMTNIGWEAYIQVTKLSF